ncbi:Uncharacterised protein [Mycobacteroides abscessus subsp. abscessus]|nr:Uncharacterised protein [Mycobacteroides abscessus subsp. abscessus]
MGVLLAGGGGGVVVRVSGSLPACSAGQPYREASAVARSPPAWCQPTMASTRPSGIACPYSVGGSRASTLARTPALRSWSAAVLATATEVGSLEAAPMTRVNGSPSLVICGGPAGALGAGGTTGFSTASYPASLSNASEASRVNATGAVGLYPGSDGERT